MENVNITCYTYIYLSFAIPKRINRKATSSVYTIPCFPIWCHSVGRHLGWAHFRFPWGHFRGKWPHPIWRKRKWGRPRWRPEAELPPSCHHHHNRDPIVLPMSWMTSVGRPDSRSCGDALLTPASPWWVIANLPQMFQRESKFFRDTLKCTLITSDSFFWLLESIWSLASPRHSRRDWVSCPLCGSDLSPCVERCENLWLQQAPTLLF